MVIEALVHEYWESTWMLREYMSTERVHEYWEYMHGVSYLLQVQVELLVDRFLVEDPEAFAGRMNSRFGLDQEAHRFLYSHKYQIDGDCHKHACIWNDT